MSDGNPPSEFDPTYRGAVIAAMGHRLAAAGPRTRQRLLDRQGVPDDTQRYDTKRDDTQRDGAKEVSTVDWWPSLMSREEAETWDASAPQHSLFGSLPPWQECVTAARRFAMLGTAASCGFAVVLLGLSQHVGAPRHTAANGAAHAAAQASLEVTPPPVLLASATVNDPSPSVGTAQPASTTALVAADTTARTISPPLVTAPPAALAPSPAVNPTRLSSNAAVAAQPVVAQPMLPERAEPQTGSPVQVSAPAAAPNSVAEPAPARIASPVVVAGSPDHTIGAPVPVPATSPHVKAAGGTVPAGRGEVQPVSAPRPATEHGGPSPWLHQRPWRPGHAAPVLLAHAAPKSHERPPARVEFDVPRWLAQHNPPHPRVVVMSDPPHFLTQPPDHLVAPAPAAPSQAVAAQEQPAPQHQPVVVASSAYGSAPFGWPANRPNYGGYYGPPQGSYYPSYYPPPSGGYYGGGAPY